ncbi:PREDICTED: uncharacterized protein LOC104612264 [Nelumbo nucifera]|uniref:Uncharacterized protein LOC104612264 n=2 Tax=Nelumbo nucifera TaxID=4432 RepID=A0A1U8BDE3_NELNU|nr:PREDICTED: uncharacterized protein LOC104612264 [Nelumbo nucifera]DAD20773.1 TPA_asm: hypothetical protein HUJ06_022236 [Nelumbo nucifera]
MSILQYPDAVKAPDLQIWNNAAFDNGGLDESAKAKDSWCPLQPIFVNQSETLESDSSKENQGPAICKSPVSVKSPMPNKPLHPNGATGRYSQGKPLKLLYKQGLLPHSPTSSDNGSDATRDVSKIDTEIEEIEMEISRLSSKLEELRLEKAERNLKEIEKRGRIVPAKFMEQKQSTKNSATARKMEERSTTSSSTKFQRRGVSLGPSEIFAGVRSRQMGKLEMTPTQSITNRRKSCFWKLQDIDEEKVTKQRGRTLSLSPKPRSCATKVQAPKQGLTTGGSKKYVKRDDGVMSSIQPKKLFKEREKSVAPKKPSKNGRVVASRYNHIPVQPAGNLTNNDRRKRSLPENEIDGKRCDKKLVSSVGKSAAFLPESGGNQVKEKRPKKRWEIPSEAEFAQKSLEDVSPASIVKMTELLPKIRTVRCITEESPRDSGPAKRVAELIGRKSYFGDEGTEVETSVCQALSFDDEEEEEEEE